MPRQTDDEREVLRAIWDAQPDGADLTEIDEDCSPTKSCRNMKDVTFDGYAEPGSDLTSAWRATLARDGKLSDSEGSVRDLVLGPEGQGPDRTDGSST